MRNLRQLAAVLVVTAAAVTLPAVSASADPTGPASQSVKGPGNGHNGEHWEWTVVTK